MNKVDDEEEIEKCLDEVKQSYEASEGVVEGLNLWRYERGYWNSNELGTSARKKKKWKGSRMATIRTPEYF